MADDDLSKRREIFGVPFKDLHGTHEDYRIEAIVKKAHEGNRVGVIIDSDPEKVARYKAKLLGRGCVIISEYPGPSVGAHTLIVEGKPV